ncbi:ATP-dependent DNA helicase [Xylanibacter caecicola]|uniref:ATP-dependent DNA helicase n=1 Tax=Xylanibacter caecicola TaxID=2736294 RepID=UPI00258867A5|nr:AAA family ATPase [Xylanibacter caecicola]
MIARELSRLVTSAFGFEPTPDQAGALDVFCRFTLAGGVRSAMILCGSAGTGKTSLAGAMVRTMLKLGRRVVLLAPTGRAAKVLSLNAGAPASTIHRKIYRQKTFTGDMTGFMLADNLHRDTLFIIDEASMISNGAGTGIAAFGSGRLLDDLVQYVYAGGRGCRMMLIGDKAQLPPVGEEESPALSTGVIEGYGLDVYRSDLTEVMRQAVHSGILWNAARIRTMVVRDEATALPKIRLHGFADVSVVRGDALVEQLAGSYAEVGTDETIVVTRSNKTANIYNRGIRAMVLGCEEELSSGDMLMIVRNNYYWAEREKPDRLTFIANGDRAVVRRVRNVREMHGFRFADVRVSFPDYDDSELQATVILDTLGSEEAALTRAQGERLFASVLEDYSDIPRKAERMDRIKHDIYYNALQVKYAYAVTCHKAQGGQWAHVYIDQGYMTDDMLTLGYIHWLYTAFTRASEKLFLVNWSGRQTESAGDR